MKPTRWMSLQTAMRRLNLMSDERFCLESQRNPTHRIVRTKHGKLDVFSCIGGSYQRSYFLGTDFEPDALYRVVEDPHLIYGCLQVVEKECK